MKDFFLQFLIIAYGATGVVSLYGYWPTIKDLYHHKKPSANISSYVVWTLTGFIGFLYPIAFIHDVLLWVVSGVSFFACLAVFLLRIGLGLTMK